MIRTAVLLLFLTVGTNADVQPESVGETLLTAPQDSWFIAKGTLGPGYIFDGRDGTMKGLLSLSPWTPSVVRHPDRAELYAAEVHYSRTYRGERTDIVSVIDHATLTPVERHDFGGLSPPAWTRTAPAIVPLGTSPVRHNGTTTENP